MCAAIDPKEPDYEQIGQLLKPAVSKQAVAMGLNGASWYVIREAVRLFEETSWETVFSRETVTTKTGCLLGDN